MMVRVMAKVQHCARGYRVLKDLSRGLAEIFHNPQAVRVEGLHPEASRAVGRVYTKLGRAVDLDPRNVFAPQQIAINYGVLRRYAEAKSLWDRVLAIEPIAGRALVELDCRFWDPLRG